MVLSVLLSIGSASCSLSSHHRQSAHHDSSQWILFGIQSSTGLLYRGRDAAAPWDQAPSREDASSFGWQPQVSMPSGCSQHHPPQTTCSKESQMALGYPESKQTLRYYGWGVQSYETAQFWLEGNGLCFKSAGICTVHKQDYMWRFLYVLGGEPISSESAQEESSDGKPGENESAALPSWPQILPPWLQEHWWLVIKFVLTTNSAGQ